MNLVYDGAWRTYSTTEIEALPLINGVRVDIYLVRNAFRLSNNNYTFTVEVDGDWISLTAVSYYRERPDNLTHTYKVFALQNNGLKELFCQRSKF